MRWFKHMTCSAQDEKLSLVIEKHGFEGYGYYWRILEVIAAQMGKDEKTSCEYTERQWAKIFGTYPKHFRKILETLANVRLIIVEDSQKISESTIIIDCPNLLRYRDEYSSKKEKCRESVGRVSGECREQDTDTDTDTDTEKEKEQIHIPDSADSQPSLSNICREIFDHWNSHPKLQQHRVLTDKRRTKIKSALKEYTAEEIKKAIDNYLFIRESKDHFFTYEWALEDFCDRGVTNFVDAANPYGKYKNRPEKQANGKARGSFSDGGLFPEDRE